MSFLLVFPLEYLLFRCYNFLGRQAAQKSGLNDIEYFFEREEQGTMEKRAFQRGLKDGIPIALGYFAVAFTFGMMAVSAGPEYWTGSVDISDESDFRRAVCWFESHCHRGNLL